MMCAVLTDPFFTDKTQYVNQSFFKTLEFVVIKETNTSFLYWLSSLFLSLKLSFSPKKMALKRVYTGLAISHH